VSERVTPYRGFHFPAEVISHAVWLHARFALSYRDVEELLAERGIQVSYESVHRRVNRFGAEFADQLRRRATDLQGLVEGGQRGAGERPLAGGPLAQVDVGTEISGSRLTMRRKSSGNAAVPT
jgi:hypothetical protein